MPWCRDIWYKNFVLLKKWQRFLALLAIGGLTSLVALSLAPTIVAAPHHPTGEFAPFRDCPLSRKTTTDCIYSVSNRGSFTVGRKTVPIKDPVTLQGGFEGAGEGVKFFGAESGETLSSSPQPVPGGLLGVTAPAWWPESLQDWFNGQIADGATEVMATLELAAPATAIKLSTENLINEEGVALGLPVKFRLDNPVLGDDCYVGSDANPIQIDFTTGRSGAVNGSSGVVDFNKKFTLSTIDSARLVNGTFAAPAASGCGGIFSFFIDPLVNALLGEPSAGRSTAILEGKLQDGAASAVRGSE